MPDIRFESVQCRLLHNINFSIKDGESVAILGPSGAGKSTLLKVTAGLLPHKGQIFFDGHSIERLPSHKRRLGYLSQDLHLFPHLNVENNIRLALMFGFNARLLDSNTSLFGLTAKESRSHRIAHALALTRASHLAKCKPAELSGGERQRAALARAIAHHPKLLLLDEPFSNLDCENKKALWQDLNQLRVDKGMTMLIVTHDKEEAAYLADRILYVHQGELSADVPEHLMQSNTQIPSPPISASSTYAT
jgi:ABC-type sugar transport system ATPase subunit